MPFPVFNDVYQLHSYVSMNDTMISVLRNGEEAFVAYLKHYHMPGGTEEELPAG
jgi:hypothetical protein